MPPSAPAPPRRDSRARPGRTKRLRAEYGPGAGAADAARHPAGDGAESSVAPSSDRVAASFTPHRTASGCSRAGSDVVFTQGCKHQFPPFCSVSCARAFSPSSLGQQFEHGSARSPYGFRPVPPFNAQPATSPTPSGPGTATKTVPTGCPSCGSGPATPVVAMPQSAPRTRRTPLGHLPRDLRVHRSALGQQRAVHAQQSRLRSVAYAVTDPRKAREAPGTGELGGHQAAGQGLGDRERLCRPRQHFGHRPGSARGPASCSDAPRARRSTRLAVTVTASRSARVGALALAQRPGPAQQPTAWRT